MKRTDAKVGAASSKPEFALTPQRVAFLMGVLAFGSSTFTSGRDDFSKRWNR
jgi:hypothetical protein